MKYINIINTFLIILIPCFGCIIKKYVENRNKKYKFWKLIGTLSIKYGNLLSYIKTPFLDEWIFVSEFFDEKKTIQYNNCCNEIIKIKNILQYEFSYFLSKTRFGKLLYDSNFYFNVNEKYLKENFEYIVEEFEYIKNSLEFDFCYSAPSKIKNIPLFKNIITTFNVENISS